MPVKPKLLLALLAGMILTLVVTRTHALPISISFLDSEQALQQTTSFLASQGIDTNSVDWFRRVVEWHNKTPLGFDLRGFPKSNNGFYTFRSISDLANSLSQPLITASHQYDLNCFDSVILLAGNAMQTSLQPDDLAGPFLVPLPPTTNFIVSMVVEETARDAFNVAYPSYMREATKLVFGGSRQNQRICLTAAIDSYCLLPHQTTEENLGNLLLRVLQTKWRQQGIVFPTNMDVVVCENAVLQSRGAEEAPIFTPFANATHAGLLFKNRGKLIYIEKAGFAGPYVRLDFADKKDLLSWLKALLTPTTDPNNHLFAIFNGLDVDSLDEIKP